MARDDSLYLGLAYGGGFIWDFADILHNSHLRCYHKSKCNRCWWGMFERYLTCGSYWCMYLL